MKPHIGAVLLNWKEWPLTMTCLENLIDQEGIRLSIVLVDNQAETPPPVIRNGQVRVIANRENRGFCEAVNQGLRALHEVRPQTYLLLNNDCSFESERDLVRLFTHLENSPEVGAIAPQVVNPDTPNRLLHTWGHRRWLLAADWLGRGSEREPDPKPEFVPMLNAACLLIRPEALERTGLWDEAYFIYYDDMDWTWRAHKAGWKLRYQPDITLFHLGSYTMAKHVHFAEYCLSRGRVIFMRRHGEWWRWPAFLVGLGLTLLKPIAGASFTKAALRWRAYLEGLRMHLPPIPKF